jgi:tetratricopeptide (TPR) repeat protein
VVGVEVGPFLALFMGGARAQLVGWALGEAPGRPTLERILLMEAASSDGGRTALAEKLGAFTDGAAGVAAVGGASPAWEPELPTPGIAIVNKWLGRYPDHPGLLAAALSFTLAANGDTVTADAVGLFERYAAARPVDPLPHQRLARYFLDQESGRERAIPHLEWLDAREQNSPAYAAELARLYSAQGDWARASLKAERAAIIAPFDPVQRELAATVALRAKDYDAAVRHITALTRLEPTRDIHKRRLEAARKLAAEAATR